jgi:protoporphyrin/coproporphyrin ferrochelatase
MSTAVIAMAYGSPSRPEEIPAYYEDIRGGRPVRPEAVAELQKRYRRIGGRSPLNEITEAQRAALERELGLPVYVGMKHWPPRIADAAAKALTEGTDHVVGLVLAPHYSRMSIGGYRDRLERALDGAARLVFIESWHDDPGFVGVLAERITAYLAAQPRGVAVAATRSDTTESGTATLTAVPPRRRPGEPHVVFTAHSLPARILDEGDPYQEQLLETSRLVAARAGLDSWSFAFQSESPTGEPWLGPDILDELDRLHERGVGRVLVVPAGFVSDHLEILWDIDVEARERAAELGLELDRIPSLNDDPAFIRALAELVRRATA